MGADQPGVYVPDEKDLVNAAIRGALTKSGTLNERLRYQLGKLNRAHFRTKKRLQEKSAEHKVLHRAARDLVETTIGGSGGWEATSYGVQLFVDVGLLFKLREALPVIKPVLPAVQKVLDERRRARAGQAPS